MKQTDFTRGSIARSLLAFTVPLMLGNILQQCYNIADTLIVGRFLGKEALAAVGSAYTLMIFLTSVLTGLSMGSGAFLSFALGKSGISFLHNLLSIVLVRVPGAYFMSKLFPRNLFPMGIATAFGSLLSVIVCVVAFLLLKRKMHRGNEIQSA